MTDTATEIKTVQAIGELVCGGCGDRSDCGMEPADCNCISEAVEILKEVSI